MGTTLDKPLYYVTSTRILACMSLFFYTNLHTYLDPVIDHFSLTCIGSDVIFFLCSTVSLHPLLRPEFVHSLREVFSSPLNFPFPLRSTTKLFLRKTLRPVVNLTKSWPWASNGWVAWVTRLSPYFRGHWVSLGIEHFINLTTINTSLDMELMSVVLKFMSKNINSFLLPFGPISITLMDVTILNELPIQGTNVLCLLDVQDSSLPSIEVSSTTKTSYFTTIQKWHDVTRILSTVEHVKFL